MAKGNLQAEADYDKGRKAKVDAKNKNAAVKTKAKADKLAKVPLTPAEMAFCVAIEPKMNNGRRAAAPSTADVLKYSKLRGRMKIK